MKLFTIIFILLINFISFSQTTAITEKGDTVLLFNDGTWEFANQYTGEEQETGFSIDTNYTPYTKSSDAKEVLKGQKTDYELWYDASKWKLEESDKSSVEYKLKNKTGEVICLVLSERTTTTTEGLLNIAVKNAAMAGEKVEVLAFDIRNVNNTNLAMLKMSAIIDDIKYIYLGYYFAGVNRTIQVVTYTFENLTDEYMQDMEMFLNGFVTEP